MSGRTCPLKNCIAISAILLLTAPTNTTARTIYVDDDGPADFETIQGAIDDSNDGDVIVVAGGTYYENIEFLGKNIVLRSTDPNNPDIVAKTIIDGNNVDTVVTFTGTENETCVLTGFTIQNGFQNYDYTRDGGGICGGSEENHTHATIRNNIITQNFIDWDGGGLSQCDGLIEKNTITGNFAFYRGGGLYGCNGMIRNNIITRNSAGWGGGIYGCNGMIRNNVITKNLASDGGGGLGWCSATIQNNTISGNSAEYGGGLRGCGGIIQNCIIWGNWDWADEEINPWSVPTYCCIRNWTGGGEGNISSDPLFVDPNNGDYHLKSQAGRWDANEGRWTKDDVTSPCIDAGDPVNPIGLEPFPNGGIINMGAYGGTTEASKSYFGEPVCDTIIAGDINGDCKVNLLDFAFMASHWLEEY